MAASVDFLAAHKLRVEQALARALNAAYAQRGDDVDPITVITTHLLRQELPGGSLVGNQIIEELQTENRELRVKNEQLPIRMPPSQSRGGGGPETWVHILYVFMHTCSCHVYFEVLICVYLSKP